MLLWTAEIARRRAPDRGRDLRVPITYAQSWIKRAFSSRLAAPRFVARRPHRAAPAERHRIGDVLLRLFAGGFVAVPGTSPDAGRD
jgi:hypothetical protein